ncbi:ORF043 [Saltwater crocodilepox virus]|nr:ORF043 [Saltwater crocodilepox virus]
MLLFKPFNLFLPAIIILLGYHTSHAIKAYISLDECNSDPLYCRNNYGRKNHSLLDDIFKWLLAILTPVTGGLGIAVEGIGNDLASAIVNADVEIELLDDSPEALLDVAGEEEVVFGVGIRAPETNMEVPEGFGGPDGMQRLVENIEDLMDAVDEGEVEGIELPSGIRRVFHHFDLIDSNIEDLPSDVSAQMPQMGSDTNIANSGSMPVNFPRRLISGVTESYNKFFKFYGQYTSRNQELYSIIMDDAQNPIIDTYRDIMFDLENEMARELARMKLITRSQLFRNFMSSVGGPDLQLPEIPPRVTDVLGMSGSPSEVDVGPLIEGEGPEAQQGSVRVLPQDPNDPLEGGSRDIFVGGNREGEVDISSDSFSSSSDSSSLSDSESSDTDLPDYQDTGERQNANDRVSEQGDVDNKGEDQGGDDTDHDGEGSEYDDYEYETVSKKRKLDPDDDSDYDPNFYRAPSPDSDSSAGSEAGPGHKLNDNPLDSSQQDLSLKSSRRPKPSPVPDGIKVPSHHQRNSTRQRVGSPAPNCQRTRDGSKDSRSSGRGQRVSLSERKRCSNNRIKLPERHSNKTGDIGSKSAILPTRRPRQSTPTLPKRLPRSLLASSLLYAVS